MKQFYLLSIFALTTTLTVCSCSKEGPQGPQGPQGEQGPAGEQGGTGARGPAGKKGDRGTANVLYSTWQNIPLSRNENDYYGNINAPKLTQNILDKGLIAVYMRTTTLQGPVYSALDYYYVSESNGAVLRYVLARPSLKKIIIQSSNNFNNSPFTNTHFRYVLVPGSVLARKSAPLPFFKDYYAVCAYYQIPE